MERALGLDIARSIAILSVLIHHLAQMCLPHLVDIHPYTSLGKYGVDVFFGLSGFLIGGLYWKEYESKGSVKTLKFILKRSLRTIPPYYVALTLSFFSVWIFRNEVFKIEYVFFIQNYFDTIPYFLVSWSLCIEEHFYIALPLLLFAINNFFKKIMISSLIILAILPLIFRLFSSDTLNYDFGYYLTATHLHYEGLIFGVILSYIAQFKSNIFLTVIKYRYISLVVSIVLLIGMQYEAKEFNYIYGLYFMRLFFALSIAGFSKMNIGINSINSLFELISKSTYSIYLIHGLIIHMCIYIGTKINLGNWGIFSLSIVMIIIGSSIFYRVVDKKVLKLRSKLF